MTAEAMNAPQTEWVDRKKHLWLLGLLLPDPALGDQLAEQVA